MSDKCLVQSGSFSVQRTVTQQPVDVFKVKKGYYQHRLRQQAADPPPVPWVQLKGYWLEAAGFIIDAPINVRVIGGVPGVDGG